MRIEKEYRGEPTLFKRAVCFIKYKILRLKAPVIEFRASYGFMDWRSEEVKYE